MRLVVAGVYGEITIFDPKTNKFGAYTKEGIPKTMFKPDPSIHRYKTNIDYFYGQ